MSFLYLQQKPLANAGTTIRRHNKITHKKTSVVNLLHALYHPSAASSFHIFQIVFVCGRAISALSKGHTRAIARMWLFAAKPEGVDLRVLRCGVRISLTICQKSWNSQFIGNAEKGQNWHIHPIMCVPLRACDWIVYVCVCACETVLYANIYLVVCGFSSRCRWFIVFLTQGTHTPLAGMSTVVRELGAPDQKGLTTANKWQFIIAVLDTWCYFKTNKCIMLPKKMHLSSNVGWLVVNAIFF